MNPYKIDEDLSLKLVAEKDAPILFELTSASREYLREWLPWVDKTKTVEDTKTYIQNCVTEYAENKSMTTVILYKGKEVGVVSFNTMDWSNQNASIGYWLGEEFQGKGIMTRAVSGLTTLAFQDLGLHRVDIQAATENTKSRHIPERLGFVKEGCLRQSEWVAGRFVDHILYAMLEDDWHPSSF